MTYRIDYEKKKIHSLRNAISECKIDEITRFEDIESISEKVLEANKFCEWCMDKNG